MSGGLGADGGSIVRLSTSLGDSRRISSHGGGDRGSSDESRGSDLLSSRSVNGMMFLMF